MGEQQDREEPGICAHHEELDASLGYRPAAVSVAVARAADRPGASFDNSSSMLTTDSRRETAHASVTTPGQRRHGRSVISAFSAHHIRSIDALILFEASPINSGSHCPN